MVRRYLLTVLLGACRGEEMTWFDSTTLYYSRTERKKKKMEVNFIFVGLDVSGSFKGRDNYSVMTA